MGKLKSPTYTRFITGPLLQFDDRNTAFSTMDTLYQGKPYIPTEKVPSRAARKGYEQKDYALVEAGRTIDRLVRRNLYSRDLEVVKTDVDVSDKEAITRQIKSAACLIGADVVGICEVNPSWIYSHWGVHNTSCSGEIASPGDAIEIPSWIKYAVVMAIEMDYEEIRRSPAIEPTTYFAYAKMAFVAPSLATYIRHLGYHAIASGNDFAINIPLAIDAGLGELGRHGLLITEQFGPRVRICKVFTDLPLEIDSPVDIGVQVFCERCRRCAEACPCRAVMSGERTDKAWDVSNNVNVLKWPIRTINCLRWWMKNGGSCAVCIRVCPYNKPNSWLHSAVRKVVKTTPLFDRLFVRIDRALGYGKQVIR